MENGQVLHSSLYVEQIDKFAVSLKQLAKTFLKLEEKKQTFSEEEIDEMFACVREEVCEKCEKNSWCWGENYIQMYQMGYSDALWLRGFIEGCLTVFTKQDKI